MQNKNGEWEIKKQILEIDLKRKEEEYDEFLEERERKTKMFALSEEEIKLKIQLMKCELNMKLKQSLC